MKLRTILAACLLCGSLQAMSFEEAKQYLLDNLFMGVVGEDRRLMSRLPWDGQDSLKIELSERLLADQGVDALGEVIEHTPELRYVIITGVGAGNQQIGAVLNLLQRARSSNGVVRVRVEFARVRFQNVALARAFELARDAQFGQGDRDFIELEIPREAPAVEVESAPVPVLDVQPAPVQVLPSGPEWVPMGPSVREIIDANMARWGTAVPKQNGSL